MKAEGYLKTAFFTKGAGGGGGWISWGWVTLINLTVHLPAWNVSQRWLCPTWVDIAELPQEQREGMPHCPARKHRGQGSSLKRYLQVSDMLRGAFTPEVQVVKSARDPEGRHMDQETEWPPVDTVKPLSQELSKPQGAAGRNWNEEVPSGWAGHPCP